MKDGHDVLNAVGILGTFASILGDLEELGIGIIYTPQASLSLSFSMKGFSKHIWRKLDERFYHNYMQTNE